MKHYLDDMVAHTVGVVPVPFIRIDGDATKTAVTAKSTSGRIVIMASSNKPIQEFSGVYGVGNLDNFKTLLDLPEYSNGATLNISYKTTDSGENVPVAITFVNEDGDFENTFRFLSQEHIPPSMSFRGARWDLDFMPNTRSVARLKSQAKLLSKDKEASVTLKTEKGNLVCFSGNEAVASGSFVFEDNISGVLKHPTKFNLADMLAILNLNGITGLKISDDGVMMFTVETELFTYQYSLLALT